VPEHAGTFVDVNDTGIDLQRNVLFALRWDGADRSFWRHAVPVAVQGQPALRLAPAHQILHACLYGYTSNPA
jgi:hypothetical protein